jgi:hypothetical protein
VPAGARTVDAGGADLYPGFINARTTMGLNEPGPRGFEDINEMHDYNPQLRTRVAYHAESDTIAVTRANGVTTVAVMPGGGIFGGEVAVMNLDGRRRRRPRWTRWRCRRRCHVRAGQEAARRSTRRHFPHVCAGARLCQGRSGPGERPRARGAGARRRRTPAASDQRLG